MKHLMQNDVYSGDDVRGDAGYDDDADDADDADVDGASGNHKHHDATEEAVVLMVRMPMIIIGVASLNRHNGHRVMFVFMMAAMRRTLMLMMLVACSGCHQNDV